MELRLLRSFLVVAQELNIGKAAKRLFIAQPPLSKQIQQLESELGIQLFDRIPKGVKLTSAGEQLVGEAKKILLTVDQAVAIVNKVGNGSQGLLQFGFSGALANSALPKMIRSIHAHYPGIEARIKRKPNSSVVLDQVISGDIDAGLVLLPIKCVGKNPGDQHASSYCCATFGSRIGRSRRNIPDRSQRRAIYHQCGL
ncbi:MAG: LysR family transcriptional regulator [Pseudomonadales bacterium]|nr:LysR family transcriptional regulator [Pseudomonadales bacterium]MBH2077016.1 LysR family transcriptional regulator [Pseudomonadales bacterium]